MPPKKLRNQKKSSENIGAIEHLNKRLAEIEETIKLNRTDFKLLEEINQQLKQLPQENNPRSLIKIIMLINQLNPRSGFIRNDFNHTIDWKHLIYMQKIILILYNENKELLNNFYVEFMQQDYEQLKEIFSDMQKHAASKINDLVSAQKKINERIYNYQNFSAQLNQ